MTVETYSVGSLNYKAAPYGETLTRDRAVTSPGLRRLGLWAELPYSRSSNASVSPRMQLRDWVSNALWGETFCPTATIVDVGSDSPPNEATVISALAEKWRSTSLQASMYLSPEGRESVSMMGESMLKIANAAHSLKTKDLGGFFRNLNHIPRSHKRAVLRKYNSGDISGAFLAAHLGWTPLIKDAYEASNISPPKQKGQEISAGASGTPRLFGCTYSSYYGDVLPFDTSGKLRIKYIGRIEKPADFYDRFGLNNPFQVAWELVPLSFVADYFLPVGDVIDSMGFISAARFSKLNRKSFTERRITIRFSRSYRIWDSRGSKMAYASGNVYRRQTSYSRQPASLNFATPLRSMKVSLPSSIMRLATISALLHQRIRSL